MDAPVMVDFIKLPSGLDNSFETLLNSANNTIYGNKGFPFDDSDFETRDRGTLHSHLDDLARRHPELAEHLNFNDKFKEFPFRSNTWGHNRGNTASANDNTEPRSRTSSRFGRPLGSTFEKEFFPFTRSFEQDPEFSQKEEPKQEEKATEKPPQVPPSTKERGRKQSSNVQQSNTVDLGQKQEPVKDIREQRSMSAPPENRAGPQRFVSSINIPVQHENDSNVGQPQAHPKQASNERVIPIHVEGRDEPVIPKNTSHSFSQSSPQPERAFNQKPAAGFGTWNRADSPPYYTGDSQFHRGEPHNFYNDMHHDDVFGNHTGSFKQQKPQAQPQPHNPPQQHQPPQAPHPPQQTQQPSQPSQQAQQPSQQPQQQPPPPPVVKLTPIEQIQRIQKDVLELMNQVEKFNGKPKDKDYAYLDEMLTRNLLKLDDVETEGKENIRNARKEAIKCIQKCISILEAKANANELLHNQLRGISTAPLSSLEVSGVSRSGTATSIQEDEPASTEEPQPENTEVQQTENKSEDATPMQTNETEASAPPNATTEAPEQAKPENEVKDVEMQLEVNDAEVPQPTESSEGSNQPMEVETKEKKEKKKVKKKVDKTEKK